jgi:hypothetical protein
MVCVPRRAPSRGDEKQVPRRPEGVLVMTTFPAFIGLPSVLTINLTMVKIMG